jgi:hypothetical protein
MKYIKLFEGIVPAHQSGSDYRNRNVDETIDVTTLDTMLLRSPVYNKGEIIIWSDNVKYRDKYQSWTHFTSVDYDFVEKLLRRVGLKLIGEPYDGGFLVKCEPGKEVESAEMVISRFPEFFDSYEREDVRMPFISNKVEKIKDKVEDIERFFESTLKKNVNVTKYNKYIDDIIKDLDNLKIK